jgi:glycosyltransferase involved in cell wall biosynthesis
MKISIVTPSFNQAQFLERTILSIWKQEGDFELEHIVIDAGSTDGSVEILKQYEKLYKEHQFKFKCHGFSFQWTSEPDDGQSHAINKGFLKSTGEILGWLNSDDTFVDNACLLVVNQAFLSSGADFVVGNFYCVDEDDKQLECSSLINTLDNSAFQKKLNLLPKYDLITQPACLFKSDVWEKYGIDQSYHYAMDWKLWISAYKDDCHFYKIDKFIANNRLHEETKTLSGKPERFREILRIFRHFDTYCFNRLYFGIYYWLLRVEKIKWLNPLVTLVIGLGKEIRRRLLQLFRAY